MKNHSIWDEMRRMQEKMDNLFENFLSEEPFFNTNLLNAPDKNKELITNNYKQPITDIYEDDKEITTEIELPGLNKEDIKINLEENKVEVKAETKAENKKENKKKGLFRLERNYAGFYRSFNLPNKIDPDKAVAEYKNGVLKIKMPKLQIENQKKKQLQIKWFFYFLNY